MVPTSNAMTITTNATASTSTGTYMVHTWFIHGSYMVHTWFSTCCIHRSPKQTVSYSRVHHHTYHRETVLFDLLHPITNNAGEKPSHTLPWSQLGGMAPATLRGNTCQVDRWILTTVFDIFKPGGTLIGLNLFTGIQWPLSIAGPTIPIAVSLLGRLWWKSTPLLLAEPGQR